MKATVVIETVRLMRKAWQMSDSVRHGRFKSSIAGRDGEDPSEAPFLGRFRAPNLPQGHLLDRTSYIACAAPIGCARGGSSKSGAVALTSRRGNCYV